MKKENCKHQTSENLEIKRKPTFLCEVFHVLEGKRALIHVDVRYDLYYCSIETNVDGL